MNFTIAFLSPVVFDRGMGRTNIQITAETVVRTAEDLGYDGRGGIDEEAIRKTLYAEGFELGPRTHIAPGAILAVIVG